MIIDQMLTLGENQAVTATAASTNVIDLGQAAPNSGISQQLNLVIKVTQDVAAAGAATVTFSLQHGDAAGALADVIVSGAIGKAALVKGAQIVLPLPPVLKRFVGANYTVGTGPLTAGAFSAYITTGYDFAPAYDDQQ